MGIKRRFLFRRSYGGRLEEEREREEQNKTHKNLEPEEPKVASFLLGLKLGGWSLMADWEKREKAGGRGGGEGEEEEEQRLLMEGVTVLDFDMLCSTVALQTQGKWRKLESGDCGGGVGGGGDEGLELGGGVFRMWEGGVLDCFEDRRIALQSSCCPCYRFGKNMKRAGFGSCFMQGTLHFVLAFCAFFSVIAFAVTKRHLFLYLAVAFAFSLGTYMGLFRTQIRKKFNIKGTDSFLDDCVYHFICPCCALCQESRTLEMNNVQDGIWHGRGDTICVGTYNEGSKAILELNSTPVSSTKCPDPCTMQKDTTAG